MLRAQKCRKNKRCCEYWRNAVRWRMALCIGKNTLVNGWFKKATQPSLTPIIKHGVD